MRDQQPEITVEDTPEPPKGAKAEGSAKTAGGTAAEAPSELVDLPEPIDILPSVTVDGETGPQALGSGSRDTNHDVTLSLDPESVTRVSHMRSFAL